MKLELIFTLLIGLGTSLTSFASAAFPICPSADNHMYINYALYNADDYFWVFADEARTQPKETKSMVTLVDAENPEQFILLVFNKKTVFSWSNTGGITGGAKHFLPDLQKRIDNGARLCPRSTTTLGVKQLKYLLTNGQLDPALSNR